LAPEAIVPVILLATREEKRGAEMRVGGLRVIDRTLRQLGRLRDAKVTIVSDRQHPPAPSACPSTSRCATPKTPARS
jgi:hypothetical protein